VNIKTCLDHASYFVFRNKQYPEVFLEVLYEFCNSKLYQ